MKKTVLPSLSLLLLISLPFVSCRKNDPEPDPAVRMKDLRIPAGFTWTNAKTHSLLVDIIGNGENRTLVLYDKAGNRLDAQSVLSNRAEFSYQLPDTVDTVRIYSPDTRISKYVKASAGQTTFEYHIPLKSATGGNFAVKLNGGSSYLLVNNGQAGAIVTQYPFTFSAWFRTTGGGTENIDMALVNIADPSYATVYHGLYLRKYQENFYKAGVKSKNLDKEYVKSTNQNVSDDTWHQVVGVFTAEGTRKLYLDGIYEGMSTSVLPYNTNNVLVTFGRWGDKTPDCYFNGLLDNICIWNRALTDAEVAAYYQNDPSGTEQGLKGYWRFEEGAGQTAGNTASLGGYSATLSSTVWENISQKPDTDGDGVFDESDFWPTDPSKAYNSVFPSGSNYYFHMYEDLWPGMGDYDFNDVILKTRLHLWKNAQNKLVGGRVISNVYWIGGGIPRGAGMEWFKANSNASQLTYLPAGAVTITETPDVKTDTDVPNAVTIFDGNIIDRLNDTIDFTFDWNNAVAGNSLWVQVYIYMNRNHEVHMFGHPPTSVADMALFGTADDASPATWDWSAGRQFTNPAGFYRTATNLPWGLEIVASEWYIPNETTEILLAYPQFRAWAESGGTVNKSWYNYPDLSHSHLP